MSQVMQTVGGMRKIATRELVLPLCACLNALESVGDGIFDSLIVAGLEMQVRVMLDGAPIAAVKRIAADEVQRPRDHPARAAAHDQQNALGHLLANQAEEFPVEIGRAPFAVAGVLIKIEKRVPM